MLLVQKNWRAECQFFFSSPTSDKDYGVWKWHHPSRTQPLIMHGSYSIIIFYGAILNGVCYTVVRSLRHIWLQFHGLQHAVCREALSFSISWSLLKFMSIELVILSNHLITLISFRIDWFDLHAIQGTCESLLLRSITIWKCPSFFSVQSSLWSNSHICTCSV